MAPREHFSADDARHVGAKIGIDWGSAPFDLEQFRSGMGQQVFRKTLPKGERAHRCTKDVLQDDG